MKRIIALIIFGSLLSVTSVKSQNVSQMSIQYDMSFTTGDLGEFISAASFRGASLQYRGPVSDNLMLGFDLAWNVFYEKKDYDSYTVDTRTLSGIQYRYQNSVPILVSVDYVISPENSLRPYVGLGIGTLYSGRETDMGVWRLQQNQWHFAMKPEVGLLYEISYSTDFKLSAKYLNGFKAGDLEAQSYFTISAGITWDL